MTSRLHRILVGEGYTAFIAVGYQLSIVYVDGAQMRFDVPKELHARVLCYVWADKRIEATWVESTLLCITSTRYVPKWVFNDTREAEQMFPNEF
jgi:hypothetical protein